MKIESLKTSSPATVCGKKNGISIVILGQGADVDATVLFETASAIQAQAHFSEMQ